MWFDPARDGEGWVLEVLADDRALLYWYTYDETGNQRWLQAVGDIVEGESGQEIAFPELLVTRGAEFGPGFDPDDVELQDVGEATMRFDDCDSGTFSYSAFGQSETIEIQRLSRTMAAGCQPINGVPGQPIKAYAGQSGSWYDLSHNGEGYSLHWLSRDEALLTWYTYDAEGNQYWLIGVGHHEDGRIVFENLLSTRGARFGEAFDPEDVEHVNWGSLVVELECSEGTASYESDLPAFGTGELELTRLTYLKDLACPWERPKFWDLYEITWNEIPIAPGDPMNPNNIQADSIANDGTVAAHASFSSLESGWKLALWRSGAEAWEVSHRKLSGQPVLISPDGNKVVATGPIGNPDEPTYPLIWSVDNGWRRLSNLIFEGSVVYGTSQDSSRIVGRGHPAGDGGRYPWVWDEPHGQQELPLTEQISGGGALAISNNGQIVVGATRRLQEDFPFPRVAGVSWENGAKPRLIFDSFGKALGAAALCNRDCTLVFGAGQAEYDPAHPHFTETWVWIRGSGVTYLGAPNDALGSASGPLGVTSDGSLLVGVYDSDFYRRLGVFIWTQRTGMVPVDGLIDELQIGDHDWRSIKADISPNGKYILLSGWFETGQFEASQNRAVVLEITPKDGIGQPE